MKNILLLIFITTSLFSQKIIIDSTTFKVRHGDVTFYLDKDTATYISVHKITYNQVLKLDGGRSNKWHKEKPFGPNNKGSYLYSGYDLGHLTPSHITSYNDSLNYHSFSLFNQAPQVAGFNRGSWAQLESSVVDTLIKRKSSATIITGVIYNYKNLSYLGSSRIKIPFAYYKIIILNDLSIRVWVGSNLNGLVLESRLSDLIELARGNGNHLDIKISK